MSVPKIGQGKRGLEGHLLYLLRQAFTITQNAVNRELVAFGLSLPQYSALTMIKAYGGLSNAELSRVTLLTPQSMNEVVQRLVAEGLVARSPAPARGRIRRLSITEEGSALLAKSRARTDIVERNLQRLAGKNLLQLKRWLVQIATDFSIEGDA